MTNITVKLIFAFIGLCFIAVTAFAEPSEKQDYDLKVYPILAAAMDSPSFVVEYTNQGPEKLYLPDMLNMETIIFDGREYTRKSLVFSGIPFVEPGAKSRHTVDIYSFLFNSERQKYSPALGRWRWQCPLPTGKHTLIVKFAGKESPPLEFQWDSSVPLLYK